MNLIILDMSYYETDIKELARSRLGSNYAIAKLNWTCFNTAKVLLKCRSYRG